MDKETADEIAALRAEMQELRALIGDSVKNVEKAVVVNMKEHKDEVLAEVETQRRAVLRKLSEFEPARA